MEKKKHIKNTNEEMSLSNQNVGEKLVTEEKQRKNVEVWKTA